MVLLVGDSLAIQNQASLSQFLGYLMRYREKLKIVGKRGSADTNTLKMVFILFLMLQRCLWAEKLPTMSLKDTVMLSLRFNPLVKSAEVQRVVDKFNLAVARNQFEFQYALTGAANQTNTVSNGAPLNIVGVYNATPTITRETVYGTQYSLSMPNNVTFNKTTDIPSTTYYNPALTFQVTQPILRGSGREIVESNLAQAYNTELQSEITYKGTLMTSITQVILDYYTLVSANNSLVVAKEGLKASLKTVKENKLRIKLGFMSPSENVQALSFVASQRLQVTSAENTVLQAKFALLRDIGLAPDTPIKVDNAIDISKINYPKGEEAKRLLFANNPSYLFAEYSLRNSKISLLQAEDQQRWTLNLVGTVTQGNGVGGNGNDGLDSLYNGRNRSRSIGLQLNVPIDNLPVQQQLVAARVNYTQQELALRNIRLVLETNLLTALENLKVLYMQVKIAKDAELLSYQSYKDALTKVGFGQSSMFEVTTLQSTYISNRINTINTEISYLNGIVQYQNLLGITLNIWHIELGY